MATVADRNLDSRLVAQAPSLEEHAFLTLQRSADRLMGRFARWLKPHALSPTQYNALRILRGAGQRGMPCQEIGERMITRDSDVTRLVDRLEKRGLVMRRPDGKDRRVVRAVITPSGLELLRKLDGPVQEFLGTLLGHLGQEELRRLIDLGEAAAREEQPSSESCP
jgi:DNA-binding MarR family transcriptional regulator